MECSEPGQKSCNPNCSHVLMVLRMTFKDLPTPKLSMVDLQGPSHPHHPTAL